MDQTASTTPTNDIPVTKQIVKSKLPLVVFIVGLIETSLLIAAYLSVLRSLYGLYNSLDLEFPAFPFIIPMLFGLFALLLLFTGTYLLIVQRKRLLTHKERKFAEILLFIFLGQLILGPFLFVFSILTPIYELTSQF